MGLRTVEYKPGVVKDDPSYATRGFASDSDQIRWVRGHAESKGGYTDRCYGDTLDGVGRGGFSYANAQGIKITALGTHTKLYVEIDGTSYDITPYRSQGTLTNQISTGLGSPYVTIAHTAHGLRAGDSVTLHAAMAVGGIDIGDDVTLGSDPFYVGQGSSMVVLTYPGHGFTENTVVAISGATALNGVDLDGEWTVSVVDTNTLQFQSDDTATASGSGGGVGVDMMVFQTVTVDSVTENTWSFVATPAASTATGGGLLTYRYEIRAGRVDGSGASGYSQGGYSEGAYGFSPDPEGKEDFLPRVWAMANYEDSLIALPLGGQVVKWDGNTSRRAAAIANSPEKADWMIVTNERIIMLFGTIMLNDIYDPLGVKWCDIQNIASTSLLPAYERWTPGPDSSAGEDLLASGSAIVGAIQTKSGILAWTDTSLHFGSYQVTLVGSYKFELVGSNCGLVGPLAAVEHAGTTYWISPSAGFYRYAGGSPEQMPSPIRRFVIDNLDPVQGYKVVASLDSSNGGVEWLYPHDNIEVNRYARVDLPEYARDPDTGWSVGTTDMTFWMDNGANANPVSVRIDGMVCTQENGTSAAGAPVERFIEYAPIDVPTEEGEGERVLNINRAVFDSEIEGMVELYVSTRRWPKGPLSEKGPFPQTASTQYTRNRQQGRQVGFKYRSNGVADKWRVGDCRYDITPGPRR